MTEGFNFEEFKAAFSRVLDKKMGEINVAFVNGNKPEKADHSVEHEQDEEELER